MRSRNMLVVVALACLLVLAGIGAWLMLDGGPVASADRPVVPRAQR